MNNPFRGNSLAGMTLMFALLFGLMALMTWHADGMMAARFVYAATAIVFGVLTVKEVRAYW